MDDALLFTDIDYYIYLGKPAKSLESINKLAEKYGDSGLLWYKTAMVAAVGKDWQAVIDASIKAVKHGADFYPSHIGLISGYAQTKAYDKAVVAAKAAQAKFPQVQFDYTDKELFGDFAQSKEYKEAFAGR